MPGYVRWQKISIMIEALYNLDNLYEAFLNVKKASGWKETTQRYEEDLLFRLFELRDKLINKTYRPTAPYCFLYPERGKLRYIESYSIDDRIVQWTLVNKILLPIVRPKLIYDNSASLKMRGTSHFRARLEKNLKEFAKDHGNEGYILVGDFTKYFDNLRHAIFLQELADLGADSEVLDFTRMIVNQHIVDVSYMTDEEYAACMDTPFNAIEHALIESALKTGKKFMHKSLGIGSHIAQIAGVLYPYKIDNYCKIVKGLKWYARYMDDFYIIHESKEILHQLLIDIQEICERLGLFLNVRKTQIVSLHHEFTILKTKYRLLPDGRLICRPDKSQFKRCRSKLKGMSIKIKNGTTAYEKVVQVYQSMRGNMTRYGITKSVISLDKYYDSLFSEKIKNKEFKYAKQENRT